MAVSVVEDKINEGFIRLQNGEKTGQRVFIVKNATSELAALAATNVKPGDRHPRDPQLVMKDWEIRPFNNSVLQWIVTFNYIVQILGSPPFDKGDKENGFEDLQISLKGEFVDGWRVIHPTPLPSDLPTVNDTFIPSNINNPSRDIEFDIGGLPIDTFGQPTSYLITKIEVKVIQVVPSIKYLDAARSVINTRNKDRFLGSDPGMLLYTGSDSSRNSATRNYTVTHTFVHDNYYHLRQVPVLDIDGKPLLAGITLNQLYRKRAYPVHWIQPFPLTSNFSELKIRIN